MFKILGWDVENSNEVSKEENISGKRVDYGFRIDGIPKFFLEAKGLNEDLDGSRIVKGREVTYAEQAINYAYYKGCNWAILTNFKGIIIYDAGAKANSSSSRFAIWIDSLLNNFDDTLYLLSRESFELGLLDKRYSVKSRKRPITEQLLSDFTDFRAILSKDVYNLNKSSNLTEEELDDAIQRLFDRLIFIRNCEDRELEPYDLLSTIRQWRENRKGALIERIRELFTHFDEVYNSKIFSKHLCDKVDISDEVLNRIISGLYTTADGSILYDFSLIDADVLGNIYEQYLGHILSKTRERTKLTESKAKRKEEGIYYTPSYIVEYIVKNTLGELIKNKKIDVSKIKVLDPACGSGSFLIKAFDILDNFYSKKEEYNQNKLDLSGVGTTYSTKLGILKDNIFGVDLDKQAVDIAQLNLLLKITEKKERLPTLQKNIQNGNSLIDELDVAGDKAFKWNEKFADIMSAGGFDVVIGNPPYVNLANIKEKNVREYFQKKYDTADNKSDLYAFFTEKVAKDLLKDGGYLGFIVSSTWTNLKSFINMRKILLNNFIIISLVPLPNGTFPAANVEPVIFIVKKEANKEKIKNNKIAIISYANNKFEKIKEIPQKIFMEDKNNIFNFDWTPQTNRIFEKLGENISPLGEYIEFMRGTKTSDNGKFILKEKIDLNCKPVLRGRDIQRYLIKNPHLFIWYRPEEMKKKVGSVPQDPRLYEVDKKIILQGRSGNKIIATIDYDGYYCIDTTYVSKIKNLKGLNINYFLALLNSGLINYWYGLQFKTSTISGYELDQIPIKNIIQKNKQAYEEIVLLVDKILLLNKNLEKSNGKITSETDRIREELEKTNEKIDDLVYMIYDITNEEKKIIEKGLKQ